MLVSQRVDPLNLVFFQCNCVTHQLPWELKTFIFRGSNPYIGGFKPSFFMVLGSKGNGLIVGLGPVGLES